MTATAPAQRLPSVWEDLLEVVYAPRSVFQRRLEYQAFGFAMIILAAVSAGIFFATRNGLDPVLTATVKQQVAEISRQNPQFKEEQLTSMQGWIKGSITGTLLLAPLFVPFLSGFFLWLTGKFFESKASFGGMLMVATYAYVPRLLGFVASSLLAVLLPEEQLKSFFSISFSPAHFADPATTSQAMLGLLVRFDLFLIWEVIITAVGVSVFGKVSMGRALLIAAIVWALGFVPLIPALMRG